MKEDYHLKIREDLIDENQKLKLLLAANFERTKNDGRKQRKVADEYVRLRSFDKGGDRKSKGQHDLLKLSEIAKELGTSEKSLKRMLRIERNLTEEIKVPTSVSEET